MGGSCVHVYSHGCRVPWHSSVGQRTVCRSWFSLLCGAQGWNLRVIRFYARSLHPLGSPTSTFPHLLKWAKCVLFWLPQAQNISCRGWTQTCTRLLSGIEVMALKLVLSFSKHTGTYLSKRIVKLAFSDWCRLLSIQLATYLKRNTEKLLLNKSFEKHDATEFEAPPSTQLGATLHGHVEWFTLFLKWKIFLNGPLKTCFNGHFYCNEKNVKETPNSS